MAGRWSSKSLRTTLKQELSVTGLMQGKLLFGTRCHVQVGIYLEECCLVRFLVDVWLEILSSFDL